MAYLKKIKDVWETGGGVYFLFNRNKELMYIGKAVNIRNRLLIHVGTFGDLDVSHNYYYAGYIKIDSEDERDSAETHLINIFKPKLNRSKVEDYESDYYNAKFNRHEAKYTQEELDRALSNFIL